VCNERRRAIGFYLPRKYMERKNKTKLNKTKQNKTKKELKHLKHRNIFRGTQPENFTLILDISFFAFLDCFRAF